MSILGLSDKFKIMRWSNCSAPTPPWAPQGTSLFFGCPALLINTFLPCPPYINTLITLFSSAPPLFITHIFRLNPGLPQGGWGQNNLTGALRHFFSGSFRVYCRSWYLGRSRKFYLRRNSNISALAETGEHSVRCTVTSLIFK